MDYFFIGEAELVTAFQFVGVSGKAVDTAAEARSIFKQLTEGLVPELGFAKPTMEPCKVLIITEEVAEWLGEDLVQWQLSGQFPLIVELPGLQGPLAGHKTLMEAIREAIGISI